MTKNIAAMAGDSSRHQFNNNSDVNNEYIWIVLLNDVFIYLDGTLQYNQIHSFSSAIPLRLTQSKETLK